MDSNAAGSMREGASETKIAAVAHYETSELFSPAERVALELADAMTITPPNVSDELFARLRAYYDEAQLVELAAIICQENYRSRFNTTFRIEAVGMYCPVGGTPPLERVHLDQGAIGKGAGRTEH
jgi:alkylhydroperoxidase family enzyme